MKSRRLMLPSPRGSELRSECGFACGLGIKPIMRPIPEGRHPGQPSRRPCVRRARGAATTPTRFLPKYPDPIFLRCGKPRAAVLAGDAVAWLARRCVIFGFGGFGSSSRRGGRPRIAKEVRDLIRRMSLENPRWGATKVHGELLKLGIDVAQSTVSIYMVPRQDRPLQTWKTFLPTIWKGLRRLTSSWFRRLRFTNFHRRLRFRYGRKR